MTIIVKNKDTLIYDDFEFRCCVGKKGFARNKIEGDNKTPKGSFELEKLYYRSDRLNKPLTKLISKCGILFGNYDINPYWSIISKIFDIIL